MLQFVRDCGVGVENVRVVFDPCFPGGNAIDQLLAFLLELFDLAADAAGIDLIGDRSGVDDRLVDVRKIIIDNPIDKRAGADGVDEVLGPFVELVVGGGSDRDALDNGGRLDHRSGELADK